MEKEKWHLRIIKKDKLICEWENDKAKNEFSNNEIYKGKIINSKKQGKGIYYYNNGDR
jgi:hypothetical protein